MDKFIKALFLPDSWQPSIMRKFAYNFILPTIWLFNVYEALKNAYRELLRGLKGVKDRSCREAWTESNVIEQEIIRPFGRRLLTGDAGTKFEGATYIPYGALLSMGSGGVDSDKLLVKAFDNVREKNYAKKRAFATKKIENYGKFCQQHAIKAADLDLKGE